MRLAAVALIFSLLFSTFPTYACQPTPTPPGAPTAVPTPTPLSTLEERVAMSSQTATTIFEGIVIASTMVGMDEIVDVSVLRYFKNQDPALVTVKRYIHPCFYYTFQAGEQVVFFTWDDFSYIEHYETGVADHIIETVDHEPTVIPPNPIPLVFSFILFVGFVSMSVVVLYRGLQGRVKTSQSNPMT